MESPRDPYWDHCCLHCRPYINDLPSVTKTCKVILYADDTAIIYSDKQKAQIENI